MEKLYAAIGDFYNEEGTELIAVPENKVEVFEAVEKIMKECPASTILTDDQIKILRAYLPAIGCTETSRDENGSLEGKGVVTKKAEGAGIAVDAEALLQVHSQWEQQHDRKEWIGDMRITRTGGEAVVKELKIDLYFLSIGQDDHGNFIVLYNEHYDRVFNDPFHLLDFSNGGQAQASRFDISKHIQWGFYMHAKATILTDDGTLYV